ncbi:MAG TPA: septum formation initiator family protein [Candidatus Paceibacterota bacterium]
MMLDIQQKRKLRGVIYNKFSLIGLGLLVVFFIHSTWGVYQKKEESKRLVETSEENLNKLREREKDISSKINYLDTQDGLEEEIRSKFSVAKENESMVVVVQGNEKVATTTSEKMTFWQKIKNFFR